MKGRLKLKGILNVYDDIFKEYEKTGIIEQVPSNELVAEVGKAYYLPLNGPLLNECPYSGPNVITKIFVILIRFRFNIIPIMADIKQAFLNVAISPEHRD